ncbi:MAG: hypothetical protein ACI4ES_05755 [Roseburia sp.]
MDAYIEKIYDMLYSPVLTPYNLLENVKLPNYKYLKYYTNNIGVVAEMQCLVDECEEKVFYYQFDQKDYLQKIYYYDNGVEEVIFDRRLALEEAKEKYYTNVGADCVAG